MKVDILNRQKALKINKSKIRKVVKEVLRFEGQVCDEVAIHFVGEEEISSLHKQFFNDPTLTDCISFPIDTISVHYRHLGEVFVCPYVAVEYAKKHKKNSEEELIYYVIHGLLHLMGYDDIDKKDRIKMREREKIHLTNLRSNFPCFP